MRRAGSVLLPFSLLAAGCDLRSLEEHAGRPTYAGPSTVVLRSAEATVTLRLDRFGMRIDAASGATVLDTEDADPGIPGDASRAYGAIGATHHETTFMTSVVEGWDHVTGEDAPWLHASSVARAAATATSASIDLFDPANEAVTIHLDVAVDGAEVRVDAAVAGAPSPPGPDLFAEGRAALNQMGQSFILPADEHFFGLGERFVTVDHRGRHYECWVEEGGIPQGEDVPPGPQNPSPNGPGMTHVPVPFLLSTRGYGLWIDTTFRAGFSLGADDPRSFRVYAAEPALHYRVLVHDDPRETLAHYTRLTGRARLPAPWVFGPRRRVDPGSMALGLPEPEALREHGVPTTMVDDTRHFLPIAAEKGDEELLSQWTASAHAMGYRAIAYFNAYVSVTDERAAELRDEGRAKGYFVKLDDGTEFDTFMISSGPQTVATVDFTNPAAIDWYRTILQRALDLGYDGWMLDFGEYLPQRAVLSDGRSGWEAHNAFPLLYDRAVYDYLREVRGDDFMFYARSGWAGTQAVTPVVWSGDPSSSFDDAKGLPAQVRAGINAGLSGIPYWGSDISGYTCLHEVADKELYLRWAEFGALSPDMHDENACAQAPEGSPPKWTLWSDEETTRVYGQYARLHTRLFPYLYAAAKEAAETGTPIMRHPVLLHPESEEAAGVSLEYYFGPALYVAPVVRRAARTRDLWLPPGKWADFASLAPLEGGARVTVDAPLDALPLFLRSGGVVAMLEPSIETLAPEASDAVVGLDDVLDVLDVRAAIDLDARTGHAELVDGTVLDVSLDEGAPALPEGVVAAADEGELGSCASCGLVEDLAGGVVRVRVTGPIASGASLAAGALRLAHHAARPLRVRWDVAVLP